MAIAFDAQSIYDGSVWGSGTTLSWAHTCSGSNRILVVGMYANGASDLVTGVTYNSVAMTKIRSTNTGTDWISLWYLLSPASGSNNITATLSTSSSFINGGGTSFSGTQQSGQPDSSNTATSATTSLTLTTTTIADNSWLVGFVRTTGTNTNGSNTTIRGSYSGGGLSMIDSNSAQTPAGSKSLNVTVASSGNLIGLIASISPSTGASSGASFLLNFI